MRLLRIIVIVVAILLLVAGLISLVTEKRSNAWDIIPRLFSMAWLILVIIVVSFSGPSNDSLLSLYIKRKRLEEQERIKALEQSNQNVEDKLTDAGNAGLNKEARKQ